jgi:hypothetical protein
MKVTNVPAQITTVEDKIAGSLSLQQVILMTVPVFIDLFIYVAIPRTMKLSVIKLGLILLCLFCFLVSGLRIKGRLVHQWVKTLVLYNLRPRYFLYAKSDNYLRETMHDTNLTDGDEKNLKPITLLKNERAQIVSDEDRLILMQLINSRSYSLRFKSNRKRGLNVYLSEVK